MQLNTIKQMERYARQNAAVVSLGQGIPARSSDARIQQMVSRKILSGHADHYSDPQGLSELRIAVSQHVKKYHMQYTPDEIIITAGAIEALNVAVRSALTPSKTNVIVPVPVYSAYFKLIELAGGRAVEVSLNENDGWSLDPQTVITAMDSQTAAVLLCNPNNPTGTVYPEETLKAIVAAAKKHGIAVIIDEVYRNMLYDNVAYYSPAQEPQFYDTVIRIMSFSKDFSLTGWRVGYIQASSQRIPELLGMHDTFINCTPVVSQYAALAALAIHEEIIQANKEANERNRLYMMSQLDRISNSVEYEIPQGAYFFFPKIKSLFPSEHIATMLLHEGVVTIPGSAFGSNGEGHLRLCFGRDTASIHSGMERLVRYFRA